MSEEGASPNKEVGYRSSPGSLYTTYLVLLQIVILGLTDLSWPSIFVVLYVISLFYLQKVDSSS